jgi:adenylyltransferase/sulfurtransferase
VDVRESHEWDILHLEGAPLIPQHELVARMNELGSPDEIILWYRSGERSARAVNLLRDAGFGRLKNLQGGINAWSRTVDPKLPEYWRT